MKTTIILMTLMIGLTAGMNAQVKTPRILVVYFSQSGNTGEVANQIKEMTGADLFRLETQKAYPAEDQVLVDQAKKEISEGYKPALKNKPEHIAEYDVIFVGSPCWWSTFAPPVTTFLSSYDFSGKTIVPFMTHEGSRMGRTVADIKKLCPGAIVLEGLPIRGSQAKGAKNEISGWLKQIGMAK